MRFDGPRLVRVRAQGLLAIVGAALGATAFGWLFGGELIGIPGLVDPIPAVRVFPALLAAIGSLALLEPWRAFEIAGARSVQRHRSYRFVVGLVVVATSGSVLSANADVLMILVLAVLIYAALAVVVGLVGRQWWVMAVVALYAQLFIQDYEEFEPGIEWCVLAVALAWPWYLGRGEAVVGRSRFERSPT